jgi:peptidoglycan/LPS O-acetylase OafA/YrhL
VAGSWTLFIEMVWYVAFAAALFTGFGTGLRLLRVFLAIQAMVTVVAALTWPDAPLGRLSIFALCFLGYAYLLRFEGRISKRAFLAVCACFHALILSNMIIRFYFNPSPTWGAPSFQCVIDSWTIALVLFPVMLWKRGTMIANARALRYLGEISYSVYLVHSLVMDVLLHLSLTGLPFLLCAVPLTLGVSALTYRYIERPGIALARRLTRPRASREAACAAPAHRLGGSAV